MAESSEVRTLRILVNERAEDSEFDDDQFSEWLDETDTLNHAAAHVWRIKAGQYADLVSMSEGNSSRQWSGAYKQAMEMADMFQALADQEGEDPNAGRPTARSKKIVRS